MTFLPFHRLVTAPDAVPLRTAYVLHGILGHHRNWRAIARQLAERAPEWRFVLVDLRCHGDSTDAEPPHTVVSAAADLWALGGEIGRPNLVMGHSFGGKVALQYALEHGDSLDQVWTLDSSPGVEETGWDLTRDVVRVVETLGRVVTPAPDRDAILAELEAAGLSPALVAWLGTSVRQVEGGYGFAFDLPGVRALLADYYARDLWPAIERPSTRVHVVRAGLSDAWQPDAIGRLERARSPWVFEHEIPGVGHWLHTDDPEALLDLLERWLPV